ncbi:MAG: SDR family oxidoreductase [Candidatus Eiseniibacteriota bacterium]
MNRLAAAPVREVVRISVEGDLLDPSLRRWHSAFLRRARGLAGSVRGRSRDRLDALGEVFFEERLKPRLLFAGVERVRAARRAGRTLLLESHGSEHVVRPLARHLAADRIVAQRFEFRDGVATGRSLPAPVESDSLRLGVLPVATIVMDRPVPPAPLSVTAALADREILLLGASGFIGKVWLASLLEHLPELGTVHVLLRRRGAREPEARFARMLRESPAFEGLRRRDGPSLEALAARIRVHEGDVREPDLGLPPATAARLRETVDLVVNSSGLTEFNPDPRDALAVNVDGVLHLLDFVSRSRTAALLHVSTCFAAGCREGRIPEECDPRATPSGRAGFDPESERLQLERTLQEYASTRTTRRPATWAITERARELGWPNIYTFTKALGERLIALRRERDPRLAAAIVRPSIVESAVAFPMRGWNEGVNTSAPLSHLLGTHFRQLPVNERKRLDVVPVDLVARGLTLVTAALLENRHRLVYQLATSATNPLDLRRAVELTSLAHRKHHRSRPGWRSRILARLEAVPVSRERYGRLSVPAQLRAVRALNGVLAPAGRRGPLARAERMLQRVKELIDLYEPFLLGHEPVFEANHIEELAAALPQDERESFGYDVRSLDWYDYWIDVHIPGLRRWSYPLIEGRPVRPDREPAGL